ncbi:hypothetical protein Tco_1234594 [Tanacetum coccineum]
MSTYLVNRSPSLAIRFKTHIDMLWFLGWLASIKQRMLEAVKVKCIFLGCRKGINTQHMNYSGIEKTTMRLFFAVAIEEKIYAYDSLTFNDIVTCKENNNDGYYWEHTPGSELENSKGVTIYFLQRKVGTYFVGGTLYIVVEG